MATGGYLYRRDRADREIGFLMKRNKWQYKTVNRTVQDMDWDEFKLAMLDFEEGEILLRKKIEWDVEQMRNFVHGPITNFMIAMFKQQNRMTFTVKEMHRWLRESFLPGTSKEVGGVLIPQPVSSELLGYDGYHQWINNMNDWCQDAWQCDLPPAEQVE